MYGTFNCPEQQILIENTWKQQHIQYDKICIYLKLRGFFEHFTGYVNSTIIIILYNSASWMEIWRVTLYLWQVYCKCFIASSPDISFMLSSRPQAHCTRRGLQQKTLKMRKKIQILIHINSSKQFSKSVACQLPCQ